MRKIHIPKSYLVIIVLLAIKTMLHLIADLHSGLDGDEVYHVDTGRHLAFGYMEFPPVIGFLACIQNLFHSQSVFVHHLFAHVAGGLIIVLCGLTVIKLGGTWKAVLLCLVCILAGSGFALTQNAFQPVVFDQLFWVLSFYFLVSYLKSKNDIHLIWLGVSIAFGFLTKYSILFFATGLLISFLFFSPWILKKKAFWLSFVVIVVIISPNVIWQWKNSFPVFAHFSRLYEVQLDKLTHWENIMELILSPNPFTLPVWLPGIFIVPFLPFIREFRTALFVVLFSFLLLFLAKGKFYYFYPLILIGLVSGSLAAEQFLISKKWIINSFITLLVLMIPISSTAAMPVLPLEKYIELFGLKPNKAGVTAVPDSYSFRNAWERLNQSTKKIYDSMPAKEKESCLIWGDTYSWASGINFFSGKYHLPCAISFHGTHYRWLPEFASGISMIAISNSESKDSIDNLLNFYLQYFEKVELKDQVFNPYSQDPTDYYLNIFYCKGLKYDSETMRRRMKYRIYE